MNAKYPKIPRFVVPTVSAIALISMQSMSQAATYTWNTATGNFSSAGSWLGGTAASGTDTTLAFSTVSSFAATDDVASVFRINSLAFSGTTTGSITVSSGTLSFAMNGSTNPTLVDNHSGNRITITESGSGKIAIETGANLILSGTSANGILISGAILGGGAMTVDASNVTLNASNTFTGGITLDPTGYLNVGSGSLGTGTLTFKGGVFKATSAASTATNAVVIAGNVQFGSKDAGNTITLSGSTLIQGAGTNFQLTVNGTNVSGSGYTANTPVILAGAIGDSGNNNGLIISSTNAGTNILLMSGTASNTYTGTTLVNGVSTTLQLGKTNGAIAIAGNLNIAAGKVQLTQSNQISTSSIVTVSATGASAATLDLNGYNQTIGALQTGGSLATSSAAITLGTGTLTLAGDYTYTAGNSTTGVAISGNGVLSLGTGNRTFSVGHVTGAGADTTISTQVVGNGYTLTKTGSGILLLNGTSNVNANVTNGELGINNALTGDVSVSAGATLSGSGQVNGAVTDNGVLSGSLTLNGDVSVGSGATASAAAFNGNITDNGTITSAFTVTSGKTLSGSGTASGSVGVNGGVINGNGLNLGTTTLNGSSTLSGYNIASSVTVASGSTTLTGTTKSTSTLSVSQGAILNANGTIDGSANVSGLLKGNSIVTGNLTLTSGTLAPGNSPGITKVDGNFVTDASSKLVADVSGIVAGVSYDQVQVNGNVSLAGTLDLSTLSGLTLGNTITLIDNTGSGTTTGYFATIITSGSTYTATSNSDYMFTVAGTEYLLSYTSNSEGDSYTNDVTLTVVPEPSTWAMIVGGLGMQILAYRVRRRVAR